MPIQGTKILVNKRLHKLFKKTEEKIAICFEAGGSLRLLDHHTHTLTEILIKLLKYWALFCPLANKWTLENPPYHPAFNDNMDIFFLLSFPEGVIFSWFLFSFQHYLSPFLLLYLSILSGSNIFHTFPIENIIITRNSTYIRRLVSSLEPIQIRRKLSLFVSVLDGFWT